MRSMWLLSCSVWYENISEENKTDLVCRAPEVRSFSLVREWCLVRSPRRLGMAEWAGGVREPGRTLGLTTSPLKIYFREWWRRMGSRAAILRYAETGDMRSPGESSMAHGLVGYSGTVKSTGNTEAYLENYLALIKLPHANILSSAGCPYSYPTAVRLVPRWASTKSTRVEFSVFREFSHNTPPKSH